MTAPEFVPGDCAVVTTGWAELMPARDSPCGGTRVPRWALVTVVATFPAGRRFDALVLGPGGVVGWIVTSQLSCLVVRDEGPT